MTGSQLMEIVQMFTVTVTFRKMQKKILTWAVVAFLGETDQ